MRRYTKYYLTSIVILISAWLINGQFASTPVNRWTKSAEMSAQRASACSVQLSDGKILIAGGRNDAAVLNTVEVSGTDGSFSSVASMNQARAGAACSALPDGRVLVAGGTDGKASLASAEVYDSRNDTWTSVGEMSVARSGHIATRTPWGAILLTGGEESGAVDLFLLNDTFTSLGTLAVGRNDHAIAATRDHKIIIAGGSHNGTALNTVEVYDGDTGKIMPGGAMLVARRNFAAAPLVDGTVLITGGYGANGAVLNTTEIFDPQKGESVAGPVMSSARANHKATVLPSNGRVLVIGGVDENGVTSSTELYTPWTRKFASIASMHTARQQMATSQLRRGAVVVAGGKGENGSLSGTEVFAYATLETDKDDYAPGEQATFTGIGWKPGEQVLLQVSAFPLDQHSVEFTAVTQADSVGRIKITPFNIDRSHLGVRFLATATGSESQAQNYFTDAESVFVTLNLSSPTNPFLTPVTASTHVTGSATNPVNLGTIAVSIDGALYCSAPIGATGDNICPSINTLLPGPHSFAATYTGDGAIWNAGPTASNVHSYQVTADTTTTLNTPVNASSAVLGTAVSFTATVAGNGGAPNPTSGTVNFLNVTAGNAIVATGQVGAGGNASATLSTLPAGAYTFAAVYVPATNNGYNSSPNSATKTYTVTKATPTLSVSASPPAPNVGQSTTITGCVATVAGFTPGGTISFRDGAAPISGSLALSGGCATMTTNTLTGGSHNLSIVYAAGDPNYNGGSNAGSPLVVPVGKATTVSAVTSSPVSPVGFGLQVTLQGTVTSSATGPTGFNIGGTATFQDNSIDIPGCTNLIVTTGSVSCNVSGLTVLTHPIKLLYLDTDTNFGSSNSPTYNLTIANASTTTSLTSNQSSIAIGGSVTYTATVVGTPSAAGLPTGSVTFFDGGATPLPGCSAVAPGSNVPPATQIFTCTKTYDASSIPVLGAGTHQITAVFTATGTFSNSTSGPVTLTVAKPQPTTGAFVFVPAGSPITYGTAKSVNAAFSASGLGPAPTGTVNYYDGLTLLGSGAINADFVLPDAVIKAVGTHTITARYNGDANYAAAVAPYPVLSLQVDKATPSFSVLTFPAVNVNYGAAVSIPVTVSSAVGTPTGTVTFTSGATTIGTVTLAAGSGTLNFNATMLAQGANAFSVVYNGDANFASITDNTKSITIQKTDTTTSVTSTTPTNSGASATFTATVTPAAGVSVPTGSVVFKSDGTTFATVALSGGTATASISTLTPGTHSITVFYAATTNFNASDNTLTPWTHIVNKGNLTISVSSDVSPSNIGQTVTLTATLTPVSPAVGVPANGSVTFYDGAGVACTGTNLGSTALPPGGALTASKAVVFAVGGNHPITACYDGVADLNFNAVTSSLAYTQVVNKAGTTTTITTSASPSVWGQSVTLNATVAVIAPAVGTPTGTVQFLDGSTVIASGTLAAGAATATTTALTVGVHSLTAKYLGDATDAISTSSTPASFTVNKANVTIAKVTFLPLTPTVGTTITLTANVTALDPGAGTPSGTVTFWEGATQIGTGTLNSPATMTIATLPAGNHTITASYSGDANFNSAPASGASDPIPVTPFTPTVVVTGTPNPDTYGQSYTLTATVTGVGAFPTNGTIAFSDNGGTIGCDAVPVTGGVATCSPAAGLLTTGLHGNIRGLFTPSSTTPVNYATANSAPFSLNILQAPINFLIVSNANPSIPGQPVTFTATASVASPGAITPIPGTVNFNDGSTTLCTATAIVAVGPSFVATCSVPAGLSIGNHTIGVTYNNTVNTTIGTVLPTGGLIQQVNQASVDFAFTSTPAATSAYGQLVTFTVTLTPHSPGVGVPTGSISFFDGGTSIGPSRSLAGGIGTLTIGPGGIVTIPLSVGTHHITAQYSGDSSFGAISSAVSLPPSTQFYVQTVTQGDVVVSQVTATSIPASPVYGQPVTLATTVAAAVSGAPLPTGTVQFFDGDPAAGGVAIGNPATLIGGAASIIVSNLSVGAHGNLFAVYNGDVNFKGGAVTSKSSPAGSVTIAQASTTTAVNSIAAAPFGATITISALVSVSAPGAGVPTGTVSFYDGTTATLLGTSAVNASATASLQIVLTSPALLSPGGNGSSVGNHQIIAKYNGGANFAASPTSPNQLLVVNQSATSSTVSSSANPSVTGQDVTFTASVQSVSPGAGIPTGTVTFFSGGSQIGIAVALSPVGGIAKASIHKSDLTVGDHVISVTYNADASFASSSSPAPAALVQTVAKAATATTISSSANSANVGQQVTLTAVVTVTAPGTGTPTGSVQFVNLSAPNQPTVLGTSPLVVTAGPGGSNVFMATLVLSNLPQGNPSIVAIYSGDTGYLTSTSAPIVQSVNKTPVNIVLTTSKSPSIVGEQVTFAITVAALPPGTGIPTGQVGIYDGTDLIGTFTLQGGQYNFTTSSLGVGNHAIGVQYAGDGNFQPFNSPTILQQVSKIPTSLGMTSNAPTAMASQIVTFTAVLSPNPIPGVPFASGQIGFYDGASLIGVTNLQSNVATINVANLTVGLHQISAVYTGDDRWSGASSGFYAQTVSLASTSTAIVSSANPAVYGQPITYTMNVAVPFPGTVPAVGQVQVYDNNNAIGDPISSANGQFSITIPMFSPGQHSIVARFIANGSFSASQSATLPQVVNKAPTVTTLAVTPNGSTAKQSISMTAVVTVPPPSLFGLPTAPPLNASLPTGSVQFVDTTFNKVLGTVPIALVGGVYTATLTTDQLAQSGSPQVLTATYSGDGYFASSTSAPVGQSVSGTQISAVNGAGYTGSNFAPDSWVTIFGDNLASGQVTAVTTPYPTSLAGTTVALVDANGNTKLLPLYFVSAGQINALIPTNTAFGLATLTVTNPQGATASTIILVTRTAPGIFSANASGSGVAAALLQRVRPDNSQAIENVATYDSASNKMVALPIAYGGDSLYLQLYGTGLRYTPTLSKVTCTIGGKDAPVLYASAAPGFYGLDQVNVQVPAGLSGIVNVVVTVDGQAANTVTLTFK